MDVQYAAIFIFVAAYALIVTEKIHRTIVALGAAMVLLFVGILSQEKAIGYIDFNTIGLLIGMMIMVNVLSETGLFHYLAIQAAQQVKARPVQLLFIFSSLTAICSAFLDNVTTVLLTVPVTFSITSRLQISPKPFLVAQILASNIGGTATLIGDPPNIMIGSAVPALTFMAFLENLAPVCILIFMVTVFLLALYYRHDLQADPLLRSQVMELDAQSEIHHPLLLKKCLWVMALTMCLFMSHSLLHMETATAALGGASLLLLLTARRDDLLLAKIFSRIEWTAIFFFAGLFILVGALVETGVIRNMAEAMVAITGGSCAAAAMMLLWFGAIGSAFIDNIPLVATLIPLIKEMGQLGLGNVDSLWWALSLGACLGGNGTLIGASANVVVAGMAEQHGYKLSFLQYMKIAFPLMLLSIFISSLYIYFRYL